MRWTEKYTSHTPSVWIGLRATRLCVKAFPTGRVLPWKEMRPLTSTARTWSSGAYALAGRVSGKGRGLCVCLLTGVSRSRAWWGRSRLFGLRAVREGAPDIEGTLAVSEVGEGAPGHSHFRHRDLVEHPSQSGHGRATPRLQPL